MHKTTDESASAGSGLIIDDPSEYVKSGKRVGSISSNLKGMQEIKEDAKECDATVRSPHLKSPKAWDFIKSKSLII
jgi:hypothetical protein